MRAKIAEQIKKLESERDYLLEMLALKNSLIEAMRDNINEKNKFIIEAIENQRR